MGYESKFYVVDKQPFGKEINDKHMFYGEKIAEFNMARIYPVSDIIRGYPKTDCYVYADDNKTEIVKDCYGAELTEISIEKLIEIVEYAIKKNDYYYKRYNPFLMMLKGFDKSDWNNLVVLHYGY